MKGMKEGNCQERIGRIERIRTDCSCPWQSTKQSAGEMKSTLGRRDPFDLLNPFDPLLEPLAWPAERCLQPMKMAPGLKIGDRS